MLVPGPLCEGPATADQVGRKQAFELARLIFLKLRMRISKFVNEHPQQCPPCTSLSFVLEAEGD